MIAVRFHGRGGQGAKTASRILGTAAFSEGFTAQDSPIYGAERRGAPVSAFTRRERGIITHPNLVVVADASLIGDPAARVTEGIDERTAVFVNSPLTGEQLRIQTALPGRLTLLNLTEIAVREFGKQGAISALLGAVAGRLVGLRPESIDHAGAPDHTTLWAMIETPAAMLRVAGLMSTQTTFTRAGSRLPTAMPWRAEASIRHTPAPSSAASSSPTTCS